MGAILIEGAKYCGKTTLCKQQAKSAIFMTDPDTLNQKSYHGSNEYKSSAKR